MALDDLWFLLEFRFRSYLKIYVRLKIFAPKKFWYEKKTTLISLTWLSNLLSQTYYLVLIFFISGRHIFTKMSDLTSI